MLKLYLNHGCRYKFMSPDKTFANLFKVDWFKEPLIIKAVEEIDNTMYVGDYVFKSPVLGLIPPEYLSGGVKTLIMSVYIQDIFPCFNLGNNCANALKYISDKFDITYTYSGSDFMFLPNQSLMLMDTVPNTVLEFKNLEDFIYDRGLEYVFGADVQYYD